jgi:hypothetical protein
MTLDMDTQSWSATSGAEIEDAGREESLHDPLVDPLVGEAEADVVQMSKFDQGPAESKTAREVFSADVENPRHVVDRAESDKTGFR